jgi:hypothetical protein
VALLLRAALLLADAFPFNADEAVVGLMARHILAGSWPTFFYGQAYLGSLDAGLVAGAFAVVGESVLTIRLVQTLVFLATVLTSMLLAREIGFSVLVCTMAGAFVAVPTVNFTLYTTVSLGGYGEALLIGNLILWATVWMIRVRPAAWAYAMWGVLAGLGLWAFGLTLIYSLPSAVVLFLHDLRVRPRRQAVRRVAAGLSGAILGAIPLIVWAAANGPRLLLQELMGSAIAGASPSEFPLAVLSHAVNLVLFGPTVALGARAPWSIAPLGMPITPLAAILLLLAVGLGLRRASWPAGSLAARRLLFGTALALVVGFVLTPFGADPSGRYFLPLAVPMAITAAAGLAAAREIAGHPWPLAVAGALVGFNLWTNIQVATGEPGFTTQFDTSTVFDHTRDDELVSFLVEQEATAGYSTYWVAYPLAFLSQERLVYLPHLPYHSDFRYAPRDDRYPPYRDVVDAAARPAYITARQPWLDAYLRDRLEARGVTFRETAIGDYRIFFDLSETVRPADLGLGPEALP